MFKFSIKFCLTLALLSVFTFSSKAVPVPTFTQPIPLIDSLKIKHNHTAEKQHAPLILRADTTQVQLRSIDSKAIAEYSKDKDFKYDENGVVDVSLWTRFWRWLWRVIGRFFSSMRAGSVTWILIKYTSLALAIAFLVYIIFKAAGINMMQVLRGESKKIEIPYSESLENIHEISFDDQIEKAIADKNFRLAVRLLYLFSLKKLNDARLIQWQIDKTNSAYLNELKNEVHRQGFGLLTRQFEYIWYGDFPIDGGSFQNINSLFQNFNKTLS